MAQTQYFLGGNSPKGFYSLYDELSDPGKIGTLYILKGGAGCGKSTLMRRVARHCEAAGLDVEYDLCSGDPDSLDAIVLPGLSTAIVDGTHPHVVEANYAGLMEQYVDLSQFYDHGSLQSLRDDIMAVSKEYKSHYRSAYRCLDAADRVAGEPRDLVCHGSIVQKLEKRAGGIIKRELSPSKIGSGVISRRFLTAVTHRGAVALWDTVQLQAERIYRLTDRYGLAHCLLSPILTAASAAGHNVTVCPDPMAPDRIAHLILPELSLAFVTDCPLFPLSRKTHRHLRLDAMADSDLASAHRPRIRFSHKVASALMEEAVSNLARAKEAHDRLEAMYNPYVDFDGVLRTADQLAENILS